MAHTNIDYIYDKFNNYNYLSKFNSSKIWTKELK